MTRVLPLEFRAVPHRFLSPHLPIYAPNPLIPGSCDQPLILAPFVSNASPCHGPSSPLHLPIFENQIIWHCSSGCALWADLPAIENDEYGWLTDSETRSMAVCLCMLSSTSSYRTHHHRHRESAGMRPSRLLACPAGNGPDPTLVAISLLAAGVPTRLWL
ncbi:hypothetical protein D9757_013096 [Collybiopsis confluens]|uniref:Uncharacterized protein n=1 Tax=Collybiopsis confluens TaxID=2823264 RepID=A0A8H5GHF7_9AGAR|nr:hypothetical protein D9757_013096 [Collybiopsis confluens]